MDTGQQQEQEVINDLDNFFNLRFDSNACDQLRQCALWAMIGAIVNFVLCAILLYLWLFTSGGISSDSVAIRAVSNMAGIGGGITASVSLFRFAIHARRGLRSLDALPINQGFSNLRRYFKVNAVFIIVGMGLLVLAFIIGIIQGIMSSAG